MQLWKRENQQPKKKRGSENRQNVTFSGRTQSPENVRPSASHRREVYDSDDQQGSSYRPHQRSSRDEFQTGANEFYQTAPANPTPPPPPYFPSTFSNRISRTPIYRPTNEEHVNSNPSHHLQRPLEESRRYVEDIENDIDENSRQIKELMKARRDKLQRLHHLDPQSARDFERFNQGK